MERNDLRLVQLFIHHGWYGYSHTTDTHKNRVSKLYVISCCDSLWWWLSL